MASLLNRGGCYYADFQDAARTPARRRLSLGTKSKRQAERMLGRLADAYREGNWDAWTQTPDEFFHATIQAAPRRVAETAAEFLAETEAKACRSTLNAYRSYTALFVSVLGPETFVERVRTSDVERYVNAVGGSGRAPSQGSKRQRLTVAKSFFTWSVAHGYVKTKPTDAATMPARPARLPKAVTDEELAAILGALTDGRAWMRSLFEFGALTGLRISELCRLEWGHVDTEQRLLRIETQKNKKAQTQPIPRSALAVLATIERRGQYVFTAPLAYAAERRVDSWTKDVEDVFREAVQAAKIERRITPHGLRHRYCTKLAEAGAGAFTIAAAARHSDPKTSQIYVSISNRKLSEELDAVFG